jgi:hypothetical protein
MRDGGRGDAHRADRGISEDLAESRVVLTPDISA